ncbi:MAG: BrnT family toxin [Gemmatimonadetes bacterium]|nr:BrnT family toxin [Gemmatimonadota bacterium]
MEFEWGQAKADANQRKHKVTFYEGAAIFGDPLAITFADPYHSESEKRFLTFGQSTSNRFLVVSHTQRDGKTRIIHVRIMTRRERNIYEEG